MFLTYSILFLFFFELICSIFNLRKNYLDCVSFFRFSTAMLIVLGMLRLYKISDYSYQYVMIYKIDNSFFNFSYSIGIDGISLLFIFLSVLLVFICFIFLWPIYKIENYDGILTALLICLVASFLTLDLLFFYIFFEAILIPMFLLIGFFGSRERKIRAAYLLMFYTLFGSLFFLLGILYLYVVVGITSFEYLSLITLSFEEQIYLWIAFFLSFAFKIPLFPFHIWLPEAHVEAPTIGSVILAGILLKLGVYGFIRFSLVICVDASFYFLPLIALLSIFGAIYASFVAVRQTDLKRIIAYSSVAHMNLVLLGLCSYTYVGISGALLQSLSHGFVSAALFFLVGILYNRYHSRLLHYYSGIVHMMPLYVFFFFFFTFANIAMPLSSSFIGEFLLLNGIFESSAFLCFLSSLGIILCGSYSLWLYNRISFGNLKLLGTKRFLDITFNEFLILLPLAIFVIIMGIYPTILFKFLKLISLNIVVQSFI